MAKTISNNELKGAVLATPEELRFLEDAIDRARRGSKAASEKKIAPASPAGRPDYAALGLDEEQARVVEQLRLESLELGRKSTDSVFEWGRLAAGLHEIANDQVHFGKLTKDVFGLSRRGAENYAAVYRHLQPFRERIVRAGIVASSLYDLASAEPKQIEEVLAAREAGRKLTGAQIKEMLGKTKAASTSPEDGGPAGLRARIAEKTATALPELMANAFALLEMVLASLEPHRRGKTVVVSEIQRPLIHPARMVQQQLEWLTWVAVPAPKGFHPHAIHHRPIVKGDRWDELHATLYKLGSVEQWPRAAEVGAWLNDSVVPQLAWLLGDRADKAFAAVEKFDAAAAAERKKAADEKTAARLARKKAKLEQERVAGEAVSSLPDDLSDRDVA